MAMTLRLSEEDQEALRATAEREHKSMQEIATIAIREYTSRRQQRRDEAVARVLSTHAHTLKRLGEV